MSDPRGVILEAFYEAHGKNPQTCEAGATMAISALAEAGFLIVPRDALEKVVDAAGPAWTAPSLYAALKSSDEPL